MQKPFKRIISADSHVVEPTDVYTKGLGKRFGDRTPRMLTEHAGRKGSFWFSGDQVMKMGFDEHHREQGVDPQVYNLPHERIKFLDEAQIEAEVIYPTLLGMVMHAANQPENRAMSRAACAAYNDWIAEFCSYNPNRLLGVGAATTDDPIWAAKELQRVRKIGLRGLLISTQALEGCLPYRSEVYDPLWAAAQDTDTPLTLHIVAGRVRDAIHVHTKEEHEDAPATVVDLFSEAKRPLANDFIFGRILDRFPKLKIVCSEFEVNWIPGFMWYLDLLEGPWASRLELPPRKMKASDYMRERVWHGIVNDPFADHAIPHVGTGQVCWGSDFPHSRSIGTDAQAFCADLFKNFSRADQEAIVGGNIAKVYGI